MKVTACWTVTEYHSAEIEIPDGEDPDEYLTSEVLAQNEDGNSYDETADRSLDAWEVS